MADLMGAINRIFGKKDEDETWWGNVWENIVNELTPETNASQMKWPVPTEPDFVANGKVLGVRPKPQPTMSPTPTPTAMPTPTRMPTPTPMPSVEDFPPGYFDATLYGGPPIPQPNNNLAAMIWELFPEEASKAATTIFTESGYRPDAVNTNTNGSTDIGLGQINSNTFADFLRRKPGLIMDKGIQNYEDMYDPRKNLDMMRIIRDEQGWNAWFGPKNRGYNLR